MLTIFEGSEIKISVDDEGRAWFLAQDVVSQLGMSKAHASQVLERHVFSEYRQQRNVGEGRPAWYIAEPGVYQLAFRSTTDKGRRFQRWVFEEVLPSIRKRGGYMQDTTKYVATADDAEISDIYATMGARKLTEAWALDCLEFDHDKETVVTNEEMKLSFRNWLRQHHRTLDDAQISKCSMYVKVHCEWRYKPPVSKDVKIKVDGKFVRGLPGVSFKF